MVIFTDAQSNSATDTRTADQMGTDDQVAWPHGVPRAATSVARPSAAVTHL